MSMYSVSHEIGSSIIVEGDNGRDLTPLFRAWFDYTDEEYTHSTDEGFINSVKSDEDVDDSILELYLDDSITVTVEVNYRDIGVTSYEM